MTDVLTSTLARLEGACALPELGLIQVSGDEAAAFLHGQLTHDFALLPDGGARLCAYCSAKGRMLASFVGVKLSSSEIWLVCRRDLLLPTLKRLSMFVLRAKVRLSDLSDQFSIYGLAGDAALAALGGQVPPWTTAMQGPGRAVALYPAEGVARALWLSPDRSDRPEGEALEHDAWAESEVRSGVATLSAALVDQLVPQMLNYESVDAVSFKKGCYPGQEVVARSQFRGTLKRRTYLGQVDALARAGLEVFAAGASPDQPSGVVVQVAAARLGGSVLLLVLQVGSVAPGVSLHLGAPDGPGIKLDALPYPLRDDI
jgi:folate-binding protein YgfZ